jgi:hypothetical protein
VVLSQDYPHLHPATRPFAAETQEQRIRRIRTDRWIAYAHAEEVLSGLEDLLAFPCRTRMPNLLIVGPTNNGKSMVLEKFRRSHPPREARDTPDKVAHVPVLKIQMPAGPDERRFFAAILEALALPFAPHEKLVSLQSAAIKLMRDTQVRLLAIDEVHNLLSGSRLQQRRLLNLLRWLGNELQIPLVAVGTAEALRAIQSDDQLANRFEPFPLPRWREGHEYRCLLMTLEAVLPLRRPSGLADSALAAQILSRAEGVLGEIIAIVTRAAVHAVTSGAEVISVNTLDGMRFISPAERRRVVV